jgi:ribonuclease HI
MEIAAEVQSNEVDPVENEYEILKKYIVILEEMKNNDEFQDQTLIENNFEFSEKNQEFWQQLDPLNTSNIRWHWVEGHSGDPDNERCDAIARSYTAKYA